jgi:hypothetical protein
MYPSVNQGFDPPSPNLGRNFTFYLTETRICLESVIKGAGGYIKLHRSQLSIHIKKNMWKDREKRM